jgi:DDE domain
MMAERGVVVDHTTLFRWVQRYAPLMEKRIRWYQRYTDASWRVDETNVKVACQWAYLYRAIDKSGETIDFMLSPRRTAKSARRFLAKALKLREDCPPETINTDQNEAYGKAIRALKRAGKLEKSVQQPAGQIPQQPAGGGSRRVSSVMPDAAPVLRNAMDRAVFMAWLLLPMRSKVGFIPNRLKQIAQRPTPLGNNTPETRSAGLSKCALKFLAELFGGILSWPPAPAFYSHFMRNFSDLLPGKERVFRLDQVHNFVDADGRVPLFAEDEFCHVGSTEPGSFD